MAWSMPPSGQWNPNMSMNAMMPPDMSNMGSYTQEQWAAMQQQNWQQWAQWQQQYAQWHNQYGEKYAEQMQSMQSMSGMPPLPPANSAPPPAPPPPDKPPPPPPHENNQPLFGQAHNQPSPVPPPPLQNQPSTANQGNYTNKPPPPSQNQPSTANQGNYTNNPPPGVTVNQGTFSNIKSVPGNNVNQGNFTNVKSAPGSVNQGNYRNTKTTAAGNNQNWSYTAETSVEKPQSSVNADALKKLAEEERLFDIQFQKWEEEIDKWRQENVNHPDKQAYKEYEQKFESCRAQLLERRQQMNQKRARLLSNAPPAPNAVVPGNITTSVPPPMQNINVNRYNPNVQTQNYSNAPSQNYKDHNQSQYQQYNQGTQMGYNKNNNQTVDPQDRYESYQNIDDNNYEANAYENDNYDNNDYSANDDNSSFLPTSASSKGIPGLDLVPETDKVTKTKAQDVIDITDDPSFSQQPPQQQQLAPDYTKISKGINNILGDEKIMNILSMVRGNHVPGNNLAANATYPTGGNNNPPYNQGIRNQNNFNNQQQYNNTIGNRQNQNMPFNRQGHNFTAQQNHGGPPNFPPQRNMYDERPDNMSQEHFHDNNTQYKDMPMHENTQFRPVPPPTKPIIPPLMGPIQNIAGQQNVNEPPRVPFERTPMHNEPPMNNQPVNQNLRPKWVEEPLFTPSIIVEYEHKALRLKARDFIEPVHMFDYNHISKDSEVKKKDFEKEVDDLFSRKPRRFEKEDDHANVTRYSRDQYSRDFERRMPRTEVREEYRPREEHRPREELRDDCRPRDDYDDRRRPSDRYDDRRRDDRDKYTRREDSYRERDRERDRERESYRDRNRDHRRDDIRNRSRSRDRDTRKRGRSRDSEISNSSLVKKSKDTDTKQTPSSDQPKLLVMIDDILEPPGREMRPEKMVIILRGLPGSGKSYLAKLIRDREAEHGGTARIMSIDDYFMQEGEVEEKDPVSGKIIKKPTLKYEYDESLEENYINSLKRAFKRSLTDGYFPFLIYDAVNDQLKNYADVWNYARQNGFQVYIINLELDAQACYKRNIHNRTLEDIQVISARFFPTPAHHIQLDPTTLLQSAAITDVHMEDVEDVVIIEDTQEPEVESIFTSKWEKMDNADQLARLDGISKPLRPSQLSMADYLQIDEWKPNAAKPGKKSVRWADIEESRQQEKMRAIGFVVGQTDWNRMTDPTMGSSALTQTKYIERVRRH